MYKVITDNGKIKEIICIETGEVYEPKFLNYTCPQDYLDDNVIGVEPMTAKEYLNEKELDKMLDSTDYIAEEKLDGTRCTMHLMKGANRLFSRRISKKTNWYAENTDSVPHLRDLEVSPEFYGTILDGEMRIDGRDFKEVSSTLNCLYDEAILRQTELGFITLHIFDIIYFKGVYVAKMPLIKRKDLIAQVINAIDFEYLKEETFSDDIIFKPVTPQLKDYIKNDPTGLKSKYPHLYSMLDFLERPEEEQTTLDSLISLIPLNKRAWYEYILLHGGEGLMLKDKQGTYKHTRGREYTKWKKFETWDVVILDYVEPTRDYTGKEADNPDAYWEYWYDAEDDSSIVIELMTMREADEQGLLPCTKFYAKDWIGTVKFGVLITDEELKQWIKDNPKKTKELYTKDKDNYLVVGETSGFDEETRELITNNQEELKYTVIEVGANELLKTGKLRHPRFLRFRSDKSASMCDWSSHVRK